MCLIHVASKVLNIFKLRTEGTDLVGKAFVQVSYHSPMRSNKFGEISLFRALWHEEKHRYFANNRNFLGEDFCGRAHLINQIAGA